MDQPLPELLSELPLTPEVSGALLDGTGDAGEALQCVLAYERGDWQAVMDHAMGLGPEDLAEVYAEALEWTTAALAASRS